MTQLKRLAGAGWPALVLTALAWAAIAGLPAGSGPPLSGDGWSWPAILMAGAALAILTAPLVGLSRWHVAAVGLPAIAVLWPGSAFAAEAAAPAFYTVTAQPWYADAAAGASTVFWTVASISAPVIAVALSRWFSAWAKSLGVNVDDALRDRFEDAVRNGLYLAAGRRGIVSLCGPIPDSDRAAMVAEAAGYVGTHLPDTVKKLGGNPAELDDVIAARLATLQTRTADWMTAASAPRGDPGAAPEASTPGAPDAEAPAAP